MSTQFFTCRRAVCGGLLTVFSLLLFSNNIISQPPVLSLTPVISTGLNTPIQFVNAGDGTNRVFIVEKGGAIKVYDAAFNFLSQFLIVTNVSTDGERGLLSLAFHPDYANNGFFYVYYTNTDGNLEIARYHGSNNPNIADANSKVIVITIPHPVNANHNGGELHFGSDGYLYLSTGDGGGAGDQPNNAQNTAVLLGKILRFNVNTSATAPYYTIPPGNPYNNEVFDLGLRNPYRWSFDRLTNDMWIGDVGQDSYEEIDYRPAGSTGGVNYGWHCYEGNVPYNTTGCGPSSSYVFPAYTYPSQNPAAAITGGIVYRGVGSPALQGYYVAADFYSGKFYLINPDGAGGWDTSSQTLTTTGIVDFGETEDGEGYTVSLTANTVYRLVGSPGSALPVRLVGFTGALSGNQVTLNWKTALEENLRQFDIEYSLDGAVFNYAGTVQAKQVPTGATYNFSHAASNNAVLFYRLKIIEADGTYTYSNIIRMQPDHQIDRLVSPSLITDGIVNLNIGNAGFSTMSLINTSGTVVFKRKIEGQTGRISINTGRWAPGIYMVSVNGNTTATQKVLIQ
jgi:glucose/arabinose dehydrogenase